LQQRRSFGFAHHGIRKLVEFGEIVAEGVRGLRESMDKLGGIQRTSLFFSQLQKRRESGKEGEK
jgi:hypothetical protein